MNELINQMMPSPEELQPQASPTVPTVSEEAPATVANGHTNEMGNRHAEAGRKGARRVHQLMQLGLVYEKEPGLKRGRQRVRQLIQEGRLYEQEQGVSG